MLLETNQTHIEGWVLPTYTMPVCERPATPPLWVERGYGFVNQTITCWVYYTADFVRIDHVVEAEILNQSIETMTITIPYGERELCGPEKVLASFPGDGSTGDLVGLQVNQSDNETLVSIPVTPEMKEAPLVKFKLIYRIFDLPGRSGVQGFDEAYRGGNQRWEVGDTISYSPGCFDEGTWKLIVELIPNSEEIVPTQWEPEEATEMVYVHGTKTTNGYRTEVLRGVGWAYLAQVPEAPRFNATFQYAS